MTLLQIENAQVSYRVATAAPMRLADFWPGNWPGNWGRCYQAFAVRDLSVTIDVGESVALVGESGCGKSSLARAITGLLPAHGVIRLADKDVHQWSAKQRAARVQMVFQDGPGSFNPRQCLLDAVAEPLRVQQPKLCAKQRKNRAHALLVQMDFPPELGQRYPAQVSGGQCQRAALARALITDPQLLVCDEPVSALDVNVRAKILRLLEEIRRERRLALLFITHDLSVARQLCDRVLVMYAGRIVEQGAITEVFTRPRHPYTRALLAAVPRLDGPPPRVLAGEPPSLNETETACSFAPRCPQVMPRCWRQRPVLREQGQSKVACHLEDGTLERQARETSE